MNQSRTIARAVILGVLVVVVAAIMEITGAFQASRQALRDGFGPEGGVRGRGVRILEELGMPPASVSWAGLASDAPSSRSVPERALMTGQWLVSIAIPEESLYDPARGILTNREGRGRAWERVGWLSVYDGHRLAFATRVGVRLHGGSNRVADSGREAFRVVFRSSYGLPHLPQDGPLETAASPPDRFVIRRSQLMPQAQPLAFAIARRIGAMTPAAQSVRFVLNGSLRYQAYELTENVSPEGWGRSFFGHEDLRFHQFRGSSSAADAAAYEALREWVISAPAPLLMADVAERVDADLFVRHLLTLMYCGTMDWAQGAAVLNLRSSQPKWFWVLWDVDQSFWDPGPEPWKRASIRIFTDPFRANERSDVRARLFQRLLHEDPRFVRYFTDVVAETFNHRLTQDYLQDLAQREKALAVREVPFRGLDLHRFFERRGDEIFDAVADALGQPRPHYVGVEVPGDVRLQVDGHEYDLPYLGRYFDGRTITVRAIDRDGNPRETWNVNGRAMKSNGGRLEVVIDRETLIRLEG